MPTPHDRQTPRCSKCGKTASVWVRLLTPLFLGAKGRGIGWVLTGWERNKKYPPRIEWSCPTCISKLENELLQLRKSALEGEGHLLHLYQDFIEFDAAHPLRKPENASAHELQQEREGLMKTFAASLGLPAVGLQSPPSSSPVLPGLEAPAIQSVQEYRVSPAHIPDFEREHTVAGTVGRLALTHDCKCYVLLRDKHTQGSYVVIRRWADSATFTRAQEGAAQADYDFQRISRGWILAVRDIDYTDVTTNDALNVGRYELLSSYGLSEASD